MVNFTVHYPGIYH